MIYKHDAVSEVAVVGLADERWIEAVSAVVALKEGTEGGENLVAELISFARERLASFKVPKHVFFVEDLPRNASGKILKHELREEFSENPTRKPE